MGSQTTSRRLREVITFRNSTEWRTRGGMRSSKRFTELYGVVFCLDNCGGHALGRYFVSDCEARTEP